MDEIDGESSSDWVWEEEEEEEGEVTLFEGNEILNLEFQYERCGHDGWSMDFLFIRPYILFVDTESEECIRLCSIKAINIQVPSEEYILEKYKKSDGYKCDDWFFHISKWDDDTFLACSRRHLKVYSCHPPFKYLRTIWTCYHNSSVDVYCAAKLNSDSVVFCVYGDQIIITPYSKHSMGGGGRDRGWDFKTCRESMILVSKKYEDIFYVTARSHPILSINKKGTYGKQVKLIEHKLDEVLDINSVCTDSDEILVICGRAIDEDTSVFDEDSRVRTYGYCGGIVLFSTRNSTVIRKLSSEKELEKTFGYGDVLNCVVIRGDFTEKNKKVGLVLSFQPGVVAIMSLCDSSNDYKIDLKFVERLCKFGYTKRMKLIYSDNGSLIGILTVSRANVNFWRTRESMLFGDEFKFMTLDEKERLMFMIRKADNTFAIMMKGLEKVIIPKCLLFTV